MGLEPNVVMVKEKVSSSNWVVDMEEMLQNYNPSAEMKRWKQQSIYRVPELIKEATDRKAYSPQLVSIGPLHHGESQLLPMEKHKHRAVLHMVWRTGKPLGEYLAAIGQVADELEAAYPDLDDKWRGVDKRGSFVEMMVTDGCFLLELMRKYLILKGEAIADDYTASDPVFSNKSFSHLWAYLRYDMIRMENQLPLLVLQRLDAVQRGESLDAKWINNWVLLLLGQPWEDKMDDLGLHILDIFHKSYCRACPDWEGPEHDDDSLRTPCAAELDEAGIQFTQSNTDSVHGVDFKNGELSMPVFKFFDGTDIDLLNLMAFELLHPGAEQDVRGYISFVDKLVDSERDVALLRSNGIFVNMMGSDRKVVEMFNTLTLLAMSSPRSRLGHVRGQVNDHCRKPWNKWRASFLRNYLSNPWVFISLVAAIILVAATVLQTVYTVAQFYTKG